MRSIRHKLLLFLPAIFCLGSCSKSFLNRQPQGSLQPQNLESKKGVNTLLIGAYAALDGQDYDEEAGNIQSLGGGNAWACAPSNWLFGSVAGGDAHKGSDGGDQVGMIPILNFSVNPSNSLLDDKWKAVYEGITRCNFVLKTLEKVTDMSGDEKTNVKAQARFLRAHYYFTIKRMFNNLPWISDTTINLEPLNTVDIWPMIEADFKFAYDSLPATQPDIARANKWAAGAYLAKTYLFEHKYTEAEPIFTDVIDNGNTPNGLPYDLNESFNANYSPSEESDNPEAVFVVENAANAIAGSISKANQGDMLNFPYGEGIPFTCCGFFQPSIDLVNSFRTDANGLPYLDDYNNHPVKNDQGILSNAPFTPDAGNLDPRLDWTVGRRGIPYLDYGVHPGFDWIRAQAYAGPFSPIKNVWWNKNTDADGDNSQWAPGSAINVFVIRFADVLLMAAEVEAQLQHLDVAEDYVNRVRHRIADHPENWVHKYIDNANPEGGFTNTPAANYVISPYPAGAFTSQDFALKAIYFERKLELAMEGYRFFDLVRWGLASTALNNYFQYESQFVTDVSGARFTANKNEYWPIPLNQIDLTTVNGKATLTQNQGYK
ncbi:MAG TPA: RagB/SusD family nutrient uptake outer membrane protein [Puia sp.]|nr:RagB/SusD family nutrient uptake outer membrane protein [Puia sp.]